MKMEPQYWMNQIWQPLQESYKFLVINITENLFKNLWKSFSSSMKSNMGLLKMQFFKILREDMDLLREKWKTSIESTKV